MESSMLDLTGIIDEVEDAQEPTIAKSGSEQKLRIVSVRTGTDKNGCDYFMPVYEVINAPMVKEFSHFMYVPDRDNLSEKQFKRALYAVKVFVKCFSIDISRPIDYEDDLPGKVGWAILGSRDDDEYGEQNTIRKYVTGPEEKPAEDSAEDDVPF